MGADQTPLDAEAIRARLDAATPGPWKFEGRTLWGRDNLGRVKAETPADRDLIESAPTDLRRLLDENARLNADLAEWRQVGAQAHQGLKDAAAELEARNNEITRMGKEIVKANEAFAKINRIIEPRDPDWKPLTERHPEWFKPVSPEEAARKKGWRQGVDLLTQRIKAALNEPTAAPEMPRPPAEEAPTEYRCPNCYRWALWTDGVVDGDDEGVEEFWCQTCGSQTPVENMDSRPQERSGDTDTSSAGSGRGTGVTEAPGTAQESDTWFTDVAESVRPVHYREAAASIRTLADDPAWAWGPIHREGMQHAADHLDAVACDDSPSLLVPGEEA